MAQPVPPKLISTAAILIALWLSFCLSAYAAPPADLNTPLDRGFSGLYNLDFAAAQKDFSSYQAQHPDDPIGPVSEAAGYLFSEFHRLGVLEMQFFDSDADFAARTKLSPDPTVKNQFENALDQTQTLARSRLQKDSKDPDALFALTLAYGLQADYSALIEKRNLASLHYTKQAAAWAQQLLSICHDCADAFVATGFSKYIIGSMSAPVRWVLRMGGLPGDKQAGIADLQATAAHGRYLAPFARILLAIAYVRDKDKARALDVLNGLRTQFPANTLFAHEIARLQSAH